jgi:hypothetical protein
MLSFCRNKGTNSITIILNKNSLLTAVAASLTGGTIDGRNGLEDRENKVSRRNSVEQVVCTSVRRWEANHIRLVDVVEQWGGQITVEGMMNIAKHCRYSALNRVLRHKPRYGAGEEGGYGDGRRPGKRRSARQHPPAAKLLAAGHPRGSRAYLA